MLSLRSALVPAARWMVVMTGVALLSISTAQAQPGGGGGRGGAGGGFGGGGFGGGGGVAGLLQISEVQTELKITDDQKTKLQELNQSQRAGFANFRDLSREEREKAISESAAKTTASIKSILTPDQFTRLEQLQVQRAGVQALFLPAVAEKLALTADQKTKLEELRTAGRPNMEGLRDASREEREKLMEEFRAKRTENEAKLVGVLTAEQKTKFDSLKGAEFKFPEGGQFGGRGGAGAPGQGRGGEGRGGRGGEGGGRPNRGAAPTRPAPADDL